MIVKLIQTDSPESIGTMVYIKGLEEYLVDISKEENLKETNQYTYLYDTSSEEVEVEPNKLFAIFVKTKSEVTKDSQILKFYMCELSETEKTCESWPLTGYCFGNFKVLFKAEGLRVVERLMNWWSRSKEPSVKLAETIVLDQQLRDQLS